MEIELKLYLKSPIQNSFNELLKLGYLWNIRIISASTHSRKVHIKLSKELFKTIFHNSNTVPEGIRYFVDKIDIC